MAKQERGKARKLPKKQQQIPCRSSLIRLRKKKRQRYPQNRDRLRKRPPLKPHNQRLSLNGKMEKKIRSKKIRMQSQVHQKGDRPIGQETMF